MIKKDFVKLGVKEGSFYKMIKDLEIDTPEYFPRRSTQ